MLKLVAKIDLKSIVLGREGSSPSKGILNTRSPSPLDPYSLTQIAQWLQRFPEKKKIARFNPCFGYPQGVAQLARVLALGASGSGSIPASLRFSGHLTQWLEYFSYKEAARVQFS